jgi:hypothetical protein
MRKRAWSFNFIDWVGIMMCLYTLEKLHASHFCFGIETFTRVSTQVHDGKLILERKFWIWAERKI